MVFVCFGEAYNGLRGSVILFQLFLSQKGSDTYMSLIHPKRTLFSVILFFYLQVKLSNLDIVGWYLELLRW